MHPKNPVQLTYIRDESHFHQFECLPVFGGFAVTYFGTGIDWERSVSVENNCDTPPKIQLRRQYLTNQAFSNLLERLERDFTLEADQEAVSNPNMLLS